MPCVADTDSIDLTITTGVVTADVIIDPATDNAASIRTNGLFVEAVNETGWFDVSDETWTYVAYDTVTRIGSFTVIGDKTTQYSPGQRIKLTQGGTVRYFLVHFVSYDGGTGLTTVVVYGGVDNVLLSSAISAQAYSGSWSPTGFDLNPDKWTQQTTSIVDDKTTSPVSGTWYNPSGLSVSLGQGVWNCDFEAWLEAKANGSQIVAQAALSILNNGVSDSGLVGGTYFNTHGGGSLDASGGLAYRSKVQTTPSGLTIYYLVCRMVCDVTPGDEIGFYANLRGAATVLRARSVYL